MLLSELPHSLEVYEANPKRKTLKMIKVHDTQFTHLPYEKHDEEFCPERHGGTISSR